MVTSYEYVSPTYSIKQFNESTYSVTKFKHSGLPSMISHDKDEIKENESKMENAFSRARSMIKQYGLCNDWDYFVTLTLDPKKYNRYELGKFKTDLIRFACDIRKKYKKLNSRRLSFVFVPENHKDGAWHMHGLLYGLPECAVSEFIKGVHPDYLVDNGFLNWKDYADKFGFVSLGIIRDKVGTVLYTTKYINKDIKALSDMKGEHLYMASRPLKTAEKVADVYGNYAELDSRLTEHYRFCSTGLVFNENWVFPQQFNEDCEETPLFGEYKPYKLPTQEFRPETIDPSVQMNVFEMCDKRVWV
ncbi:MAG: hypothetical protein CVU91_02315 [Firmicutes bacterium HGW-Firmicutes-16]|nr:MAG: hypothetical protein CVU91_02315 [Firmicutes bacterium HGW-Firmicutes-16]